MAANDNDDIHTRLSNLEAWADRVSDIANKHENYLIQLTRVPSLVNFARDMSDYAATLREYYKRHPESFLGKTHREVTEIEGQVELLREVLLGASVIPYCERRNLLSAQDNTEAYERYSIFPNASWARVGETFNLIVALTLVNVITNSSGTELPVIIAVVLINQAYSVAQCSADQNKLIKEIYETEIDDRVKELRWLIEDSVTVHEDKPKRGRLDDNEEDLKPKRKRLEDTSRIEDDEPGRYDDYTQRTSDVRAR